MKYVNTGALWKRQKKSDKAPDMGGEILLTQELIDSLPRDADGDLRLEVSAWVRQTAKGEFLSLRAAKPYNAEQTKPAKPVKKEIEDDIPDPWA
jgi:hypothetical protein